MDKKIKTSYGLTPECKRLLKLLAEKLGVSQTDVIEMAVREGRASSDSHAGIPMLPSQDRG